MATAQARADLAASLKQEAGLLLHRSGLFRLLEDRFGKVKITGSAGYDLMVWRDIDIHMPVDAVAWADWAYLIAEIARQFETVGLTLHKANFVNDYVEPHPLGAGLYWGLEFYDFDDNPWKCDLWGWEPFDFAVRETRDESLKLDLARADRDLILRLKTEARQRLDYHGVVVNSFDIYRFVIKRAGETLEELEAWKRSNGAPTV